MVVVVVVVVEQAAGETCQQLVQPFLIVAELALHWHLQAGHHPARRHRRS
jgi:hypothetical protein